MFSKPFILLSSVKKFNYSCRSTPTTTLGLKLFTINVKSFKRVVFPNSQLFCTGPGRSRSNESGSQEDVSVSKDFKAIYEENKEKLKYTEKRLKEKGHFLLNDIKKTKNKVREKVEEVIERENVYTLPNFLCVTRIALSPYLGFLIVETQFDKALFIIGIAAVTDLLDGWIARTWKSQSSKIGSFLDPMADKILIGTLFLTLTYVDLIPLVLTGLIIARDALLVAAGFVIRYLSLPPPRTLSRYFDMTHATAQLAPTFISKVNTAVQLLLIGSTLAAPVFNYVGHPALEALCYFGAQLKDLFPEF
ncbi:probable cardiolipin synthase (CMP-forming) isoform X4 [Diabrotica undecimpunctata]|uniref:probable cardiolipin synthase (CMP-forming) isoform X4 n=1 Tax=Diabrotica undecimpunctata TaxID=50387 RepID=UPI003B63F7A7